MDRNIVEFIKYNRDALDLIMDLVPIPLFVKDRAGFYIDCNEAFTSFLSVSREQIIGKSAYDLWRKEEADIFTAQDNALFQQGGLQIYETYVTSSDGSRHIVQFHKQVFTDSAGVIAGFLGAIFDITQKKKLENTLAQLATVDELTGLPNRRDGMIRLEILHKDAEKKRKPYCIAMIDIDHFKLINDKYGHNNGDSVIKAFSDFVSETLRGSDTCFRFGGDEFVILLPETELDVGLAVIERIRRAWAEHELALLDFPSIHSTISIGLAQYAVCFTLEQLLHNSDKALYSAKNSGRNRTVCSKSIRAHKQDVPMVDITPEH